MSFTLNQQEAFNNPEFYQQKANQLRLQNEHLRRQLQGNFAETSTRKTYQTEKTYPTMQNTMQYNNNPSVPVRQVIYNPVTEAIRPPAYIQRPSSFENYAYRTRTEPYLVPPTRDMRYASDYAGSYNNLERKNFINQVQDEIIDLQARGYKLERQANRLSSYIKGDLRDFIRDSDVHKECSYKQKYLKSIANRPRYFRFNV